MSNLGYYPNTVQYWQEFINIVNETDYHLNDFLNSDNPSSELPRWIAELFINNARRMLALPTSGVNPEVLNIVNEYVECYHAFSNHYYDLANWVDKIDTSTQEIENLDNPFTSVGSFFEGVIGGLTGINNAFNYESTFNRLENDQKAIEQKEEELKSVSSRLFNYYDLLLARTNQLRDRLFS